MITIKTKNAEIMVDDINDAVEILYWAKHDKIHLSGITCQRCNQPRSYGSASLCRECYLDSELKETDENDR